MKTYTPAGKEILKFAIDRNMTLKDVATAIKISYSHLMNLMNGTRDITRDIETKIENALKLEREEKFILREAVFISNQKIIIPRQNTREFVLRLFYWLYIKRNVLSQDQVNQCMEIIKNSKRNPPQQK